MWCSSGVGERRVRLPMSHSKVSPSGNQLSQLEIGRNHRLGSILGFFSCPALGSRVQDMRVANAAAGSATDVNMRPLDNIDAAPVGVANDPFLVLLLII